MCEPPGDCRSDLWFVYHLGRRLKQLYVASDAPRDVAIRALSWDYPVNGATREPDAAAVLREINGYRVVDRAQVAGFQELKDALTCSLHKGRLANPGGSGRGQ